MCVPYSSESKKCGLPRLVRCTRPLLAVSGTAAPVEIQPNTTEGALMGVSMPHYRGIKYLYASLKFWTFQPQSPQW